MCYSEQQESPRTGREGSGSLESCAGPGPSLLAGRSMSPPATWTSFLWWCGGAELLSRWTGESEPRHRCSYRASVNTSPARDLGRLLKKGEWKGEPGKAPRDPGRTPSLMKGLLRRWRRLALACDTTAFCDTRTTQDA